MDSELDHTGGGQASDAFKKCLSFTAYLRVAFAFTTLGEEAIVDFFRHARKGNLFVKVISEVITHANMMNISNTAHGVLEWDGHG